MREVRGWMDDCGKFHESAQGALEADAVEQLWLLVRAAQRPRPGYAGTVVPSGPGADALYGPVLRAMCESPEKVAAVMDGLAKAKAATRY
jgi:hypothetical protein